jgi:hypothetical protein
MGDILTEELAAIRRVRELRFRELTRDLEERALRSNQESSTSGSGLQEAPTGVPPASSGQAQR